MWNLWVGLIKEDDILLKWFFKDVYKFGFVEGVMVDFDMMFLIYYEE